MIYLINKFHETEAGATASSVVINNPNEIEAEREAQKQFRQLGANYMADTSVKAWSLMLVQPKYNTVIKKDGYTQPVEIPEEPEAE